MPPHLLSEVHVPYPEGAFGDVTVTLTIVVTSTGAVREAVPSAVHEPFSSAAANAAMDFSFEPATRDGKAVASKIRCFRPGSLVPETVPSGASSTAPRPPAPRSQCP